MRLFGTHGFVYLFKQQSGCEGGLNSDKGQRGSMAEKTQKTKEGLKEARGAGKGPTQSSNEGRGAIHICTERCCTSPNVTNAAASCRTGRYTPS